MGRHAAPDEEQEPVEPGEPGESAGPVGAASADPYPGTRGDLHLLRDSPALRARCAAAILVPFLVYTIVLIVIGRTDVYLIWLWIPTVLAGVLVGVFLDSAHRSVRKRGTEPPDGQAAAVPNDAVPNAAGPDDAAGDGPDDAAGQDQLAAAAEARQDPEEPAVVEGPEVGLDIVAGSDGVAEADGTADGDGTGTARGDRSVDEH